MRGFESDLLDAMDGCRSAFAELLRAIGADSRRPQDVCRRYGINRNLAWKLSKIIHADDVTSTVGHLPGAPGLRILLDTCRRHGASDAICTRVEQAMDAFESVVQTHATDRAGLDVLLSSLGGSDDSADVQEASRRQAFLGNSAIWGVQARIQLGIHVHVPSALDDWVDAAAVGGLFDFRRLRHTANWPLVRHQAFRRAIDGSLAVSSVVPLDPGGPDGGPPLVRAFSSVEPDALSPIEVQGGTLWEMREGPIGLTGTVDCVFGRRADRIGRQRAQVDGDSAVAAVPINTPCEKLQIDVFVHEDLAYADVEPRAEILSRLETSSDPELDGRRHYGLPVPARVVDMGAAPPLLHASDVPRYPELVQWTLERMGHDVKSFRAWRLSLTYPPIPAMPLLRFDLSQA
ncbi:MAG: hypothetical protein H6825_08190 [Planctomycetes bacterium]|nr:hypothetical protein [Planctomycetota bacterium]